MPKLTLSSLTSSYRSNAALNANFDAIEAAIENTLSRDGTSPNSMAANFDMGSNRVINLLDPTAAQDGATKAYVDGLADTVADINAISHADGVFIVSDGTDWVGESGATARASMGVSIGSDVQAYDADLTVFGDNPLTAAELTQLQNINTTTVSSAQWGYLGSASAFGGSLIDDATAGDARTTLGLGTISTQAANSVDIDGGAIDGTTIGATSTSTGAFTTLSASGDTSLDGDLTLQSKFIVVESPGTGVDALAALHAARDAVGVGGTIMLVGGQDYEISANIQMNVEGQTLFLCAGSSITSQTPASGNSVVVTADNCTVMGTGTLDYIAVTVGSYSVVGSGTGFRMLGNLVFKDPLTRAVNVVDVFGDDPIIIEGVRVYWTTAGVANAKTGLPLIINVETDDTTSNGENVIIRDCEVDYSAWTLEDLAEVSYPSSGAPNTIGIRIRSNNESTFTRWRVEGCTVIMPTATVQSDWDPVTYGNAADAAGGRRPTCFEITAIRNTLTYSSKSAGFTAAETVTGGTSGATCVVGSDDTTTMQVYSITGQFEQGETITGGTSGSTATFESLQGNSREGVFLNNRAIGGDLGFSFGGIDTLAYSGNRVEYQTSYPLEFAGGQVISGAGNYFDGRYAGKAVSCTNTKLVSLPGSYVVPGANTVFSTSNTGVTLEGVGRLNMSGSTFKAGADSISMIRIRPGGGAQSEINLTGCTFLGDGFSTLKAVHVDQGTVSAMILNGCVFRDIDTNSLIVDSGTTITNLITTGNVGVSAGAFTNNGTITNHIDNNNLGITGLTGASSYDESNVAITGGTIDGITGTNLDINSGSIDGTAIGSSSRSTGYFSEIGIGTSGPAFGDFELVSSGNAQMKIHSNFSGSTTSGLYIDTSGDTSDGKVIFQKDGVSRGVFTYSHAASGGSEYFGINVAGGTDKLTVEGSGHVGLNNNAPAYACDAGGDANVTGVYRVSGTQVVGAQGATISDPTGGSTVDTEARTAINALIDRLQAHGLIA